MNIKRINSLLILVIITLSGCASVVTSTAELEYVPKVVHNEFDPLETPLAKVYKDELTANPEQSGAILINSGTHALFHRIALVRMAEHTVDLQTYIYEKDLTSSTLMYEMKQAADRGVKIRILIDDNGLKPSDTSLLFLDHHPNIEIKIFNPYVFRNVFFRYPQLVLAAKRLNYRMHNKLFIVDNVATIIGGRNVAANYFDNSDDINFTDTDVMFIGKLAADSTESFNKYWNYHRSVPAIVFPERNDMNSLVTINKELNKILEKSTPQTELYDFVTNTFMEEYNNKRYPIYWGEGILIDDEPEKVEGKSYKSPIAERYLKSLGIQMKCCTYLLHTWFRGKIGQISLLMLKRKAQR